MTTDPEVCGESHDHDEVVTYRDDETTQYECRRCGAEWWEDASDQS